MSNNEQLTAILIGAGPRAGAYTRRFALNNIRLVAVAEPDEERRNKVKEEFNLPEKACYNGYKEILGEDKMAELAIICTNDRQHIEPSEMAVKRGYHILLEKPISPIQEEVYALGELAGSYDKVFAICHVLRYSQFFSTIKEYITNGSIGKIISVNHNENIGYWFQAQNFVRGKWNNSKTTSPMILAKSCHDFDILLYLIGVNCIRLSSFGHLSHFRPENAPEGATKYCLDGCPHFKTCQYNIVKINVDPPPHIDRYRVPWKYIEDAESYIEDMKTSRYGRCVYYCDNDVVDHQVVSMEFEDGITAVFTMCAFNYEHSRSIKIMGTEGEISGDTLNGEIIYKSFKTGIVERIEIPKAKSGHSGGDDGLLAAVSDAIKGKNTNKSSAEESVQSHMMAFAAEQSRLEGGTPINIKEYTKKFAPSR